MRIARPKRTEMRIPRSKLKAILCQRKVFIAVRTLVYLQIIMKLQSGTDSSESPLSILKQSDQLLAFIKHALESAREQHTAGSAKAARESSHGLNLSDLRIIEPEDEADTGGDSDDEDEGDTDEELTSTALNLLLAVLEGDSQPILATVAY